MCVCVCCVCVPFELCGSFERCADDRCCSAGDARRRTLSPSVIRNRLAELARTSKQLAGPPRRADNQPRTSINIPVELPDLLTHFRIAAREGTSLPPLTPEDASAPRPWGAEFALQGARMRIGSPAPTS